MFHATQVTLKVKVKSLSRFRLLATLWTAAYQAPLSMGFCRQEYWSGLPLQVTLKILIEIEIEILQKQGTIRLQGL